MAKKGKKSKTLERDVREFALAGAGLAILMACLIIHFGHQQFGGNDQGVLVDGAYRLYVGQRPYIDFPTTQPILFQLGGLWGLQLFGLNWSSFIYIAALYSITTCLLQLTLMWRMRIAFGWALAITATVQMGALVSASYWWYNPVSDTAICLLVTAAFLVIRMPESLANWALYAGCLFLASLAKPNVAGVGILTCSIALGVNKETRIKGLLFSFGAFLGFLALLALYRINFFDMFHSYFAAAGRGVPVWSRFIQDAPAWLVAWHIVLLIAVLAPLTSFLFFHFQQGTLGRVGVSQVLPAMGALAACFYGSFTNGELKVVEAAMPATGTALLCLLHPVKRPKSGLGELLQPSWLLRVLLAFIMVFAFWIGSTRFRVECIGPGMFYQPGPISPVGASNRFFSNLESGPIFRHVIQQTTEAMAAGRRALGRTPRIFFGQRMNWGYAAFDLQPPLHIPYSWWAGVDYPKLMLPAIAAAFADAKFDYCIFFLHDGYVDFTYMPPEIIEILQRDFVIAGRWQYVLLLKRKT